MQKYILALNCGSSSLKFNLFLLMEQNRINPVIEGVVEEIGNIQRSRLKLKIRITSYNVCYTKLLRFKLFNRKIA